MAESILPPPHTPCITCHESKPAEAFPSGRNQCRACRAAKVKAYYLRNREPIRAQQQAYRLRNAAPIRAREQAYRLRNREQIRAEAKAFRLRNREQIRAEAKAFHIKNPEQGRARSKAWYATHGEQSRANSKAWRATHPERASAATKVWREKYPEKVRAYNARRRARKLQAPINDYTPAQWEETKAAYGHRCVYCGRKMQRLTQDHIVPLAKGGNHTKSNIVPACQSCNSKKGARAPLVPVQPLLL